MSQPGNRFVSFVRACVRASEAVRAREAMLPPLARQLNSQRSSWYPRRSEAVRPGPCPCSWPICFTLKKKNESLWEGLGIGSLCLSMRADVRGNA